LEYHSCQLWVTYPDVLLSSVTYFDNEIKIMIPASGFIPTIWRVENKGMVYLSDMLNEVRKNSWVYFKGVVTQMKEKQFIELYNPASPYVILPVISVMTEDEEWIKPIPLTPDILERCGFEKGAGNPNYHKLHPPFFGVISEIDGAFRIGGLDYLGRDVKYLHQLQNLYFALTGEELECNLDQVVIMKGVIENTDGIKVTLADRSVLMDEVKGYDRNDEGEELNIQL
jgi:hypothetical protein